MPWFLKPDYTNSELTTNADATVIGGTWEALVEHLIMQPTEKGMIVLPYLVSVAPSHYHFIDEFTVTFLTMFRSFASAEDLIAELVRRYTMPPPALKSKADILLWVDKKQQPTLAK